MGCPRICNAWDREYLGCGCSRCRMFGMRDVGFRMLVYKMSVDVGVDSVYASAVSFFMKSCQSYMAICITNERCWNFDEKEQKPCSDNCRLSELLSQLLKQDPMQTISLVEKTAFLYVLKYQLQIWMSLYVLYCHSCFVSVFIFSKREHLKQEVENMEQKSDFTR